MKTITKITIIFLLMISFSSLGNVTTTLDHNREPEISENKPTRLSLLFELKRSGELSQLEFEDRLKDECLILEAEFISKFSNPKIIENSKAKFKKWTQLLAKDQITLKEFEWLINGWLDCIELRLKLGKDE